MAFDLAAATGLLIVSAPVMLLTALAILIESGRPIIFRQERVGAEGRIVHQWIVPAKVAGNWSLQSGNRRYGLRLDQKYQQVRGTATVGGSVNKGVAPVVIVVNRDGGPTADRRAVWR